MLLMLFRSFCDRLVCVLFDINFNPKSSKMMRATSKNHNFGIFVASCFYTHTNTESERHIYMVECTNTVYIHRNNLFGWCHSEMNVHTLGKNCFSEITNRNIMERFHFYMCIYISVCIECNNGIVYPNEYGLRKQMYINVVCHACMIKDLRQTTHYRSQATCHLGRNHQPTNIPSLHTEHCCQMHSWKLSWIQFTQFYPKRRNKMNKICECGTDDWFKLTSHSTLMSLSKLRK